MPHAFEVDSYTIRRKFFTVLGASFHIYDDQEQLIGFCKQKAFKLREDIRVFEDEAQARPLLTIKARQAIDFSASYDIVDATTNTKVGAARRKGFTSILRDSWEILDADDRLIDKLQEDSTTLALVRRFLSNLVPQKFHLGSGVIFRQRFNPVIFKMDVSIENAEVDRRLILGVAALVAAIEGRQSN
ncbi:hypothetical protein Poly30_37360 [Planctomycetes bacterium Poly30]|uniref:Uncharacterized protein n=1 Tax=Saltatorellus ferox TaxID=2528018 RepID=A0A518EVT0_9BACT|nr:hypothetical protein Poly30_37360 [Planctomycetes bacterium Poly30]